MSINLCGSSAGGGTVFLRSVLVSQKIKGKRNWANVLIKHSSFGFSRHEEIYPPPCISRAASRRLKESRRSRAAAGLSSLNVRICCFFFVTRDRKGRVLFFFFLRFWTTEAIWALHFGLRGNVWWAFFHNCFDILLTIRRFILWIIVSLQPLNHFNGQDYDLLWQRCVGCSSSIV